MKFLMCYLIVMLCQPIALADEVIKYKEVYDASIARDGNERSVALQFVRGYIFHYFAKYKVDAECALASVEAFENPSDWEGLEVKAPSQFRCIVVEISSDEVVESQLKAARDSAIHLFLISCLKNQHVAIRRVRNNDNSRGTTLRLFAISHGGTSVRESKEHVIQSN